MVDNVIIRKATTKDLENIQNLNKKLFIREFEKYNKLLNVEWTFGGKGTKYFSDLIQNDFVYIAEVNNKVVGYLAGSIHNKNACFTEQFAEIENMYIEKEYRRLNIGTKLISNFKEYCRQNKVKYIKVSAWSENVEAIKFYEKNNFEDYEKTLVCKLEEK